MFFTPRITHHSYDSVLYDEVEDGCRMLELVVRTHITFQQPNYIFHYDDNAFPAIAADQGVQNTFTERFQSDIYGVWNNKLYLVHDGSVMDSDLKDIKCGVTIRYVPPSTTPAMQGGVQLRVNAVRTETGHLREGCNIDRANCTIGGAATDRGNRQSGRDFNRVWDNNLRRNVPGRDAHFDMNVVGNLSNPQNIYRGVDTGQSVEQKTIAHEFGHYLGLDHQCINGRTYALTHNATNQYCLGATRDQIVSIMAYGSVVYPQQAWPWKHRLARHAYYPHVTWTAVTEAQLNRVRNERHQRVERQRIQAERAQRRQEQQANDPAWTPFQS